MQDSFGNSSWIFININGSIYKEQDLFMMNKVLFTLALAFSADQLKAAVSWDNPPVMCPEEVFAKGLKCPDFSRVENPYTDFPYEMSKEEILEWRNNKAADLKLCRNQEVLRRESLKPGSYSAATIENAWMIVDGANNVQEKLTAIEEASKKYEMPPHVLIGAMKQESLFASLGISPDGGNFSCGMSQLNIQEWCTAMSGLSRAQREAIGWPSAIECDSDALPTNIVKPFYDIAVKNLGTRPSYQLTSEDFKGIAASQVVESFPTANKSLQEKRYQAVTSFVNNCQNIALSVNFKAKTLKGLYDHFVPDSLKQKELYTPGKITFNRVCRSAYTSQYYPLHTGWLLAVAMYNAGPAQAKLVGYYYQSKSNNLPAMNPLDLIEALHWGGKWKPGTDSIVYADIDSDSKPSRKWFKKNEAANEMTQSWFKSCIVQRHVARVIQHVTLPAESIAKSLEVGGCTPTGVPEYRQKSSGIKN